MRRDVCATGKSFSSSREASFSLSDTVDPSKQRSRQFGSPSTPSPCKRPIWCSITLAACDASTFRFGPRLHQIEPRRPVRAVLYFQLVTRSVRPHATIIIIILILRSLRHDGTEEESLTPSPAASSTAVPTEQHISSCSNAPQWPSTSTGHP